MNNELNIRTLTDRFFAAETTLDEEQKLYAYYRQPAESLPEDLRQLRPMFLDLAAVAAPAPVAEAKPPRTGRWRWAAAAVAVVVLAGGALLYQSRHEQTVSDGGELVGIVYGQRTTDPAVVLAEMQKTMTAMHADGGDVVERELKAMFAD